MLVFSRREGESIILNVPNGGQITIKLTEYVGQQTKIGIETQQEVDVLREKLCHASDI